MKRMWSSPEYDGATQDSRADFGVTDLLHLPCICIFIFTRTGWGYPAPP
jgi:hypothetical protein